MIEYLFTWVAAILSENRDSMSVSEIIDRMNSEILKVQPRLDVLLSLDRRFQRMGPKIWSINPEAYSQPMVIQKTPDEENISQDFVERAISLRQQAIDSLLEHRARLQRQVSSTEARLQGIESSLIGLDYDQSPKRVIREKTPDIHRPTISRSKEDQRYRATWPLPGDQSKLLDNLLIVLERINKEQPTRKVLTNWFQNHFQIGNWAWQSILCCVIYPGFAMIVQDQIVLTDLGREYLDSQDASLVVTAIRKSFWGIEEMLAWLEEQPLTMDQLHRRFNSIGAGWKKVDQVRYRLNWLLAAGYLEPEPGSRPVRYMVVRS